MRKQAKSATVYALANEADLDVDEALVRLWDAGIEDVSRGADIVSRDWIKSARVALDIVGLPALTVHEAATKFGVTEEKALAGLRAVGYSLPDSHKRLPLGATARLNRFFASQTPVDSGAPSQQPSQFVWHRVGRISKISYYPTRDDVNNIHWELVERSKQRADPISPPGIRDITLFESAIARPTTSLGGQMKYETLEMGSAALLHSLALNHAFHNGNKRTALVSCLVMLYRNGYACTASEQEALKMVVKTASHGFGTERGTYRADAETLAIAEWICANNRPLDHSRRTIKFHTFRKMLSSRDCLFAPGGKGNRINISRVVTRRGLLGFSKQQRLVIQVYYRNDGTDVADNTIAEVRRVLELDEDHGYDDSAFFEKLDPIDEVITSYQMTLDRLSRI